MICYISTQIICAVAIPKCLSAFAQTNMEQTPGYGKDEYTARAKELVLEACGLDKVTGDVVFLVGGTQTNTTVIDLVGRSLRRS